MKRWLALVLMVALAVFSGLAVAQDKNKDKEKESKNGKDSKDVKPSPEALKDLEAMSGTFAVTLYENDGKKDSPEQLKRKKVVQNGAVWKFIDGSVITEGIDRLDPSKNPKEIDSTYTSGNDKDKKVMGIYVLEGESVKLCWAKIGKPRPTEFATKSGSDLTLMVLTRISKDVEIKEEKKVEKKEDDKKKEEEKKEEPKKKKKKKKDSD